jgi:hypothetical protein
VWCPHSLASRPLQPTCEMSAPLLLCGHSHRLVCTEQRRPWLLYRITQLSWSAHTSTMVWPQQMRCVQMCQSSHHRLLLLLLLLLAGVDVAQPALQSLCNAKAGYGDAALLDVRAPSSLSRAACSPHTAFPSKRDAQLTLWPSLSCRSCATCNSHAIFFSLLAGHLKMVPADDWTPGHLRLCWHHL